MSPPGGMHVRVDSGLYAGYRVPPYYDSMIGKLIVYGVTRDDCIMRLKRALEEFVVEGMKTTVPLQQKIIRTDAFQRGDYTIKWLEHWLEESRRMKATIWHNPACGTSRKTLEILEQSGADVAVIDYLQSPYDSAKLEQLLRDANVTPVEALRLRGTDAEERGLPQADDATIIAAMVANPAYVNRPLVETDKGVRLCRPQQVVHEIL